MRELRKEEKFKRKIIDQKFSNIIFEELIIYSSKIKRTIFENIHFKRSDLGYKTKYEDCEFINCKFWGQYMSLGASTSYSHCKFINCDFTGVIVFSGSIFYDCQFSGRIKNAIIEEIQGSFFSRKKAKFNDCDLSDVIFHDLDINGNCFNNCLLPKAGIRKFRNDNDELINRALDFCSKIETKVKIESEIIFDRKRKSGQNPIILDEIFLKTFFKSLESEGLFYEIVEGYEI